MLTAVIVDDEVKSRRTLQHLVEEYCPNLKILATAQDVLEGVKIINAHHPDVVFLDIEMPNYSGFKLIEFFDEISFDIIFTTAYEQHAIRAFKSPALGYLLKPISIDELITVVNRCEQIRASSPQRNANSSGANSSGSNALKRITMPTQNALLYLNMDEISFLESTGRYTNIYLIDGTTNTTTLNLKACLELLIDSTFIRIHRSFAINLAHIKKYGRGRDSFVFMEPDNKLNIGKNYKDDLMQAIALFVR